MRSQNVAPRDAVMSVRVAGSDQPGLRRALDGDPAAGEWLAKRRAELALLSSILAGQPL
jgi:hypothetical protein